MPQLIAAFQAAADYLKKTQPGVLAFTMAQDAEDGDLAHDFQVFADMHTFGTHADLDVPEIKALIDEWFSHYDFSGEKGPAI